MGFKKTDGFVTLLITLTLFLYLLFIVLNSSSFIDIWPLEKLFGVTVITIIIVTVLSLKLSWSKASIMIPLIVQVFLVVIIPVLKYPNKLNFVGPWDSVAHFSFAKWILTTGHIDTAGNTYYSYEYGFHPGNGIIPAVLNLLTSINLGWSMNIALITIYLGYLLFLLATLKMLKPSMQRNLKATEALWLLAFLTLSTNLLVYYFGVTLGYIYVSGILYIFVKLLARSRVLLEDVVFLFLIFLGSLLTHLSTTIITITYLIIAILVLPLISVFNEKYKIKKNLWNLSILISSMVFTYSFYEIFLDMILFRNTLRGALYNLYLRYIAEITIVSHATDIMGATFPDLLKYLISQYTKNVIVLGLITIHTPVLLLKWRLLNFNERIISLLLFASYPTWLIGWAGTGSFFHGYRAQSIICFLLALNLALTYEKLYKHLIVKSTLIVPLVLIILGFVGNFGLPFKPTLIGEEGELYKYPTASQGGFSDYVLHSIIYVNSYATSSSRFLCLRPYVTFGICDLMWQTTKIPKRGSIVPHMWPIVSPRTIIELIESYSNENIIVPQPLNDRLLSGPIGYYSLYGKTFQLLLKRANALIYNNMFYTIFSIH